MVFVQLGVGPSRCIRMCPGSGGETTWSAEAGQGCLLVTTFPHSQQAATVLSRLSVCQPGELPRLTALGLPRLDSEKPRAFGLGCWEVILLWRDSSSPSGKAAREWGHLAGPWWPDPHVNHPAEPCQPWGCTRSPFHHHLSKPLQRAWLYPTGLLQWENSARACTKTLKFC